jgi:HYR domain
MKRIQSKLSRALGRRLQPLSAQHKTRFAVLALAAFVCSLLIAVPTVFVASGNMQKGLPSPGGGGKSTGLVPSWQQAVKFAETPALRDLKPEPLTPEQAEKLESIREDREKNEENTRRVKPDQDPTKTQPFIDPAINNSKHPDPSTNAVTPPIQSFDGPDMDFVSTLFGGGRFAPPDTNAAVGPNHVVITTNSVVQVFNKTGTALTVPARISTLLVGIANAADDDGDPIVIYDSLADRWIVSQFDVSQVTANSTHQHIAVSKTSDPTGAYYAYDFLMTANRPADYPHMGVWSDGYYMSTNDFSLPVFSNPFQGAGLYCFERAKMLVGDPTALVIRFNTDNTHGGMLPSNLQGFTPPPVGTPNLFGEFDAAIFGAPFDLVRFFAFHADFVTPAASTLTQGPNIATAAFDARNSASRADMQQPAPSVAADSLDSIADRLMHALNFRVLPGGIQSYVLNFTVNVSGVNPTNSATYEGGVRWMELRRNAGTGVVSINQQATYAPGAPNPTGRDLWMAGVAQDGEGNIALAANATNSTATPALLNPTIIYTGRLPGDPVNTLPQGEVDGMSAVTKGVQTGTGNRWGDYSSLFVDPADECTFWGAFEYVDSPTASFDWNTRIVSFKVNPACVTAPRGTINGTITYCASGLPILNAVITTPEGFFRQTNAAGQFSMIVTPGTYTVTVSGAAGSGLGICTQTVTVAANGTATVNCCLAPSATIISGGATLVAESCTPANGALDPNETVTVSFCVQNTGGGNTTNLVGTLQATGGVTSPNGPQNYGVVVAGGPVVCRNFTFTVTGTCGGTVTASIQFQDGATNLGTLTYTFTLGVQNIAFTENFDGVTAPALPAGWVSAFTNGDGDCTVGGPLCTLGTNWTTSSAGIPAPAADTAPNSAFHNDPSCVTNNTLDTPTINITSASSQLTFRNNFDLENTFDGGVLEISINGGAFTDIVAAGGSFSTGGYNGTISTGFLSPIAGRSAWTNTSAGFITTTANLPAAANGQPIKLRFRMASDCSVSDVGWRIDTISISSGFVCSTACGGTPCVLTCPANITRSNDPNQCGAVVTYPAPTSSGTCGTITCTPASGSFFPVGTTTVTCTSSGGAAPSGDSAPSVCTPHTITQSSSQAITALNSVSCNNGIGHTENSYYRAFTLSSFGIAGQYDVASVDIGVELANAGGTVPPPGGAASSISKNNQKLGLGAPSATSQPITVKLYTSSMPFPTGFPGSLTQIGITNTTVNDTSLSIINIPVTGSAPAGSQLVVEILTPDGTAAGNLFFIGSNAAAETGPSYLRAPACGITNPTTTAAIGFPSMHIVMNVNGCEQVAGGGGPSCTFTVTVNDTQPPVITCSCNLTAVTPTPGDPCTVVNFTTTATDNCPGVVVVCNPPSGSCFPVGVTTVTCTATDASGNTATCSFTISVFNGRLQDDFEGCNNTVLFNTITGDYRWCCHGTIFTGRGKITRAGDTIRLEHVAADRRVRIDLSAGSFPPSGNAALQSPPGTIRCVIQDRDTRDDTCVCGAGACQ